MRIDQTSKLLLWPYKTKTERMILQDIFLMLKCLQSDTFTIKNFVFKLKDDI